MAIHCEQCGGAIKGRTHAVDGFHVCRACWQEETEDGYNGDYDESPSDCGDMDGLRFMRGY